MATSIINRLPCRLLSWHTPFELLYNKAPDYSLLKVFGCLCFATITRPHKDEFAPRATKCIFLGLSPGQKAYRLYDLSSHAIFVSRDVIFHETIFPFQTIPPPTTSPPLPTPSLEDTPTSVPIPPPPSTLDPHPLFPFYQLLLLLLPCYLHLSLLLWHLDAELAFRLPLLGCLILLLILLQSLFPLSLQLSFLSHIHLYLLSHMSLF